MQRARFNKNCSAHRRTFVWQRSRETVVVRLGVRQGKISEDGRDVRMNVEQAIKLLAVNDGHANSLAFDDDRLIGFRQVVVACCRFVFLPTRAVYNILLPQTSA